MKLSIIIPCYNESKNLPLILEKFASAIKRDDIEVLLVNNGSKDNSQAILDELIPHYAFARVVRVEVNEGYGFGIASGLKEARGEFIGYTHADMQTDPADPIKALDIIEKQANSKKCYVKGNRKGRPLFDQFFSMAMSLFETLFLCTKLWDINAQPNIFHRSFFEDVKDNCPKDFSLDLYLLFMAKKKGISVKRFDVVFSERTFGKSSWNTGITSKFKFIKRTIDFSVKLKKVI